MHGLGSLEISEIEVVVGMTLIQCNHQDLNKRNVAAFGDFFIVSRL